jgi:dihydroxyacetone kinase-like predicted kinase
MGAFVVEGGQGENPSAADLARAVEETGSPIVVLLPDNKNIVPTAEQVGSLVDMRVHVVPTTSIAAGLAVMVAYDAEGEPDEVVDEMREICESLTAAEVTRAVRDASIGDRRVSEGSYIGFLSGELIAVEETVHQASLVLARRIVGEGADFLTLLKGDELDDEESKRIVRDIGALHGDLEIEVRDGGQPLYPLQMVAE